MSFGIGLIADVPEFNRRAAKALRSVELQGSFDRSFGERIPKVIEAGGQLTEKQQMTLYQVVNRYAARIWDKQVTDYAAARAKEYA